MKKIVIILFLTILIGCKNSKPQMLKLKEDVYLKIDESNLESKRLKELAKKSKINFVFESSTGNFHGKYHEIEYKGHFLIKKTSSGFRKGFRYKVELESLEYENLDNKYLPAIVDFMTKLWNVKSIQIEPNDLMETKYVKLEMFDNEHKRLQIFVLIKL